jgi:hypothetical protein
MHFKNGQRNVCTEINLNLVIFQFISKIMQKINQNTAKVCDIEENIEVFRLFTNHLNVPMMQL